jgi:hypothetical protein
VVVMEQNSALNADVAGRHLQMRRLENSNDEP